MESKPVNDLLDDKTSQEILDYVDIQLRTLHTNIMNFVKNHKNTPIGFKQSIGFHFCRLAADEYKNRVDQVLQEILTEHSI
mgnify:CR=1 FL=1